MVVFIIPLVLNKERHSTLSAFSLCACVCVCCKTAYTVGMSPYPIPTVYAVYVFNVLEIYEAWSQDSALSPGLSTCLW